MIPANVELHNVAELVETENGPGRFFSRVPNAVRLRLPPADQRSALCAAGAEVRCNLEEGTLRVVFANEGVAAGIGIVEVYQGPFQVSWQYVRPKPQPTEIVVSLPGHIDQLCAIAKANRAAFDARLTRILLPHSPVIRLLKVEAPRSATCPRKDQTPAKRCLAYGTSLTQGNGTVEPTGGYAMRASQMLGADLINLGFGNGGRLEREIADYMASRADWDFAILEIGTNSVADPPQVLRERVAYMLATLARAWPERSIFCLDIFVNGDDFGVQVVPDGACGPEVYRQVVRDAVRQLNKPNVRHIEGLAVAGDYLGLSADLVHPSQIGMEQIARNLCDRIRPHLDR